jgi:hypothetical protein
VLDERLTPEVHMKDCDSFARFMFDLHNAVNDLHGKRSIATEKFPLVEAYFDVMADPNARVSVTLKKLGKR